MFKLKQVFEYNIQTKNLIEVKTKLFLDQSFVPIIFFAQNKGLQIEIPSCIDGWDASFLMRKLEKEGSHLGKPAEELIIFLYSRLKKTQPVYLEHINTFKC
jgi:hypothetical protein